MSGISLAVDQNVDVSQKAQRLIGSVGTIELQLFAIVFVFAASGLVPISDIIFAVFVPSYLYILTKTVFPSLQKEGGKMEVFHGSRNFQLYLMLGTILGLFLPLGYVLALFTGRNEGALKACTPHLFLLSAQILTENIVHNLAIWSPPVRAFLVAIYTARRIFSLGDWVSATASSYNLDLEAGRTFQDIAWTGSGYGLALANLIYYNVNMFCFVIPRFIPRAFQRYYEAQAAISSNATTNPPEAFTSPSKNPPEAFTSSSKNPPKKRK